MHTQLYLDLALFALVTVAGVWDLAARRIPNRLLAAGLLCAAALHLGSADPLGVLSRGAAGFATGLLLFLPLYLARGMAAGDVKLLATVGAFSGPPATFHIALATCCIGGVMGLLIVLWGGRWRALFANLRSVLRPFLMRVAGFPLVNEPLAGPSVGGMPYGLAIALGSMLIVSWRHS